MISSVPVVTISRSPYYGRYLPKSVNGDPGNCCRSDLAVVMKPPETINSEA